MATVNDVLRSKASPVLHAVGPDATVLEALQAMAETGVGALVVTEAGRLVGIVSERDYARKVALKGLSSRTSAVRDIMTSEVICAAPADTVEQCLAIMTERRLRHLPVMDNGALIGLVSIGDLVKTIIAEQQFLIAQLERYIRGEL